MAKAQDDGLKKLKAEAQSLYENGMKLTDIAKKSANQMAQSAAGRAKADGDIAAIKINVITSSSPAFRYCLSRTSILICNKISAPDRTNRKRYISFVT